MRHLKHRGSAAPLRHHLESLQPSDALSSGRASAIGARLLASSPLLKAADFRRITAADLWLLFADYDQTFFRGHLGRALGAAPRARLQLRLSSRMTRAGGKLLHFPIADPVRFEISVSSHLLFTNFEGDAAEPFLVNGVPCRTRLDALQRIFEHELVHLAELLTTGRTSCRKAPFRALAYRLFGHTEATHRLPTSQQRAWQQLQVRPGSSVAFRYRDQRLEGFVNRISKRATVLVPDPDGQRYSDGRRYAKYYVPIEDLERRKEAR